MEWTDIFSGPAFEPVKSRELHLGKDCDLSRPLVVRDTDKLTVEVAGGAALRLVVLHTKPCQAEIRIKLLEGADAELVQLFSAEAFVDFQVEQAAGSKFRMTACQFTSANVRYRFDLNGREASNELDVLFLALEQDHCVVDLRTNWPQTVRAGRSSRASLRGPAVVNSADWFMWRRMPSIPMPSSSAVIFC